MGKLPPSLIYSVDEGEMPPFLAPHHLKKTGELAWGVGHENRRAGPASPAAALGTASLHLAQVAQ